MLLLPLPQLEGIRGRAEDMAEGCACKVSCGTQQAEATIQASQQTSAQQAKEAVCQQGSTPCGHILQHCPRPVAAQAGTRAEAVLNQAAGQPQCTRAEQQATTGACLQCRRAPQQSVLHDAATCGALPPGHEQLRACADSPAQLAMAGSLTCRGAAAGAD